MRLLRRTVLQGLRAARQQQQQQHSQGLLNCKPLCVDATLAWSEAVGNKQVPWASMQQQLHAYHSSIATGSSKYESRMPGKQQGGRSKRTATAHSTSHPTRLVTKPSARPHSPADHDTAASPASSIGDSGAAAGPAFKLPSELENSEQYKQLLRLICNDANKLQPWQSCSQPTLRNLFEQERAKLVTGSDLAQASRLKAEATSNLVVLLKAFQASRSAGNKARAAQIPNMLLLTAAAAFRKFIMRSATPGLAATLIIAGAKPRPALQLQQPRQPQEDTQQPSSRARETGESPESSSSNLAGAAAELVAAAAGADAPEPLSAVYNTTVENLLMHYFIQYCKHHYKQEMEAYAAAVATLDLRSPHTWYPFARALNRKIIYHGGPTNSGKTYNALQSLAAAERGVYCAPLRLLAMEVYETLNHRGVYCDLVTGQEVMRVPGSSHVACTVEMANLGNQVDVAIIDEIQLIGDDQRGFAWTRALLGLPANVIHVCGDASAVQLVKHLAGVCGDEFELHTYDRMTPLQVDTSGLPGGWADVTAGDAVVAFSRRSIYKARKAIEAATGQRTCIVYGALPAETRRAQARLFNDPNSGANILIASDAIGLGLNFNIRRVIFTTMSKTSRMGHGKRKVPVSLVKQIAGRAGRRNSLYPEGYVTTLEPVDLPTLQAALDVPATKLYTPAAGLAAEYETIELLSGQFPSLSLEQLLKKLDAEAKLDGRYFLCNQEQLLDTARVLERVKGLSLPDQFTLVNAPVDPHDNRQRAAFLALTNAYAAGKPALLNEGVMPAAPPATEAQMAEAESLHKILCLWLWLSYRFEEGSFPGRERVHSMAKQLSHWLNIGLQKIQTAEQERSSQTTAAAAAALERQEQGQEQEQGWQPEISSSVDKVDSTAACAAGAGSDASNQEVVDSDADDINDEVFDAEIVEIPAGALGMSASADIVDVAPSVVAELHKESSVSNGLQQQQQQQQQKKQKKPAVVAYINWGSSIVSSGLASHADNSPVVVGGDGRSATGPDLEAHTMAADQLSTEAHFIAAGSHTAEVLEQLMMPELDPSMTRFLRWRTRPRFVVPARPVAVADSSKAGGQLAQQ